MVELVDTKDLKSFGHCGRAGSSPASGTSITKWEESINFSSHFLFLRLSIDASTMYIYMDNEVKTWLFDILQSMEEIES